MEWITQNWRELVGYLAPIFIAASMMQSHVKTIRLLMVAGCVTFILYGYFVAAWPVVVANILIGGVTIFYLVRSRDVQHEFSLLNVRDASAVLPERFIDQNHDQLLRLFPQALEAINDHTATTLFFLKNLEPVGIFCYRPAGRGTVEIVADYVVPAWRDSRTDAYLYHANEGYLVKQGYHTFVLYTMVPEVQEEMKRFGFKQSDEDPLKLVKTL